MRWRPGAACGGARRSPFRGRRLQVTLSRIVVNAFILVLGQARNERLDTLRAAWPGLPRLCVEETDLLQVSEDRAFTVAASESWMRSPVLP